MQHIYIYDGPFEKGEKGWPMVRRAAAAYCSEMKLDLPVLDCEIIREEKRKPYFVDMPLEFSLTHSGQLWMCAFGQSPCGLDLQEVKDCRFEEIAVKHFTKEEQHYVELWGIEGFFDVWVRKEAFCKCTGQGFFSKMPSVIDENTNPAGMICWNGAGYWMKEIAIAPDLKCAVCSRSEGPVEMRML